MDDELASRATDVTVPKAVVVPLPGVMTAWSPTLIWPTWVSSTLAFTTYEPFEMTTIWSLDELVPVPVEPVPAPPVPPAPPAPPVPPVPPDPPLLPVEPPLPDTCCPTVRLTEATVPVIGEVRVASASALCALVTWFWAAVTAAWSAATWVLDAPLPESVDSRAWSEDRLAWASATVAERAAELTVASA